MNYQIWISSIFRKKSTIRSKTRPGLKKTGLALHPVRCLVHMNFKFRSSRFGTLWLWIGAHPIGMCLCSWLMTSQWLCLHFFQMCCKGNKIAKKLIHILEDTSKCQLPFWDKLEVYYDIGEICNPCVSNI